MPQGIATQGWLYGPYSLDVFLNAIFAILTLFNTSWARGPHPHFALSSSNYRAGPVATALVCFSDKQKAGIG